MVATPNSVFTKFSFWFGVLLRFRLRHSCSSIPSHNSKDAISSHNSRNTTCLTPIPSQNSKDTFWATTQGRLARRPLRYPRSLIDHAPQSKQTHLLHSIAWRGVLGARRIKLQDHLAGDAYRQAPRAFDAIVLQLPPGGSTIVAKRHDLCCFLKLQLSPSRSHSAAKRCTSTTTCTGLGPPDLMAHSQ